MQLKQGNLKSTGQPPCRHHAARGPAQGRRGDAAAYYALNFGSFSLRSRIYRWYGQLRKVEAAVEQAVEHADPLARQRIFNEQMAKLDDVERRVNQLTIPLSFAKALYDLRSHIYFVRKRLGWLMQLGSGSDAVPKQA